jgi:hypothetical protein
VRPGGRQKTPGKLLRDSHLAKLSKGNVFLANDIEDYFPSNGLRNWHHDGVLAVFAATKPKSKLKLAWTVLDYIHGNVAEIDLRWNLELHCCIGNGNVWWPVRPIFAQKPSLVLPCLNTAKPGTAKPKWLGTKSLLLEDFNQANWAKNLGCF